MEHSISADDGQLELFTDSEILLAEFDPVGYVEDFIRKFDLYEDMTEDKINFRVGLGMEEQIELTDAVAAKDSVKIIDALCDQVFIAIGTALMMGFDFRAHFTAVAEANLAKVRGVKPERPDSGGFDVIKPPGWVPPEDRHAAIIDGATL